MYKIFSIVNFTKEKKNQYKCIDDPNDTIISFKQE